MYPTSVYRTLTCKCVYICLCIYMYTYFQIFISVHHLKQDTVKCHFRVARVEKLPSSSSFCVCRKCALLQLSHDFVPHRGSSAAAAAAAAEPQCSSCGGTAASRHCPVSLMCCLQKCTENCVCVCLPRPARVLLVHLPAIPL